MMPRLPEPRDPGSSPGQALLPLAIVAALAMLLAMLSPGTARGQAFGPRGACYERSAVIEPLAEKYSERPVGIGMGPNGSVIELLTAPSGSWTILMSMPSGVACIVAAGEGWESLPVSEPVPAKPGERGL